MSDDFSPYGLNHVAQARRKLERGEPCSHPGCLSHVSHPCEGCGRVGGTLTLFEALALEAENKRLTEENARLTAENAAIAELEAVIHDYDAKIDALTARLADIKERRCETCSHHDERGWCDVNGRSTRDGGFCDEHETKESADA